MARKEKTEIMVAKIFAKLNLPDGFFSIRVLYSFLPRNALVWSILLHQNSFGFAVKKTLEYLLMTTSTIII